MTPHADTALSQSGFDLRRLSLGHLDGVEMVGGLAAAAGDRAQGAASERFGVAGGDLSATLEPAVQPRQKRRAQDCRVELVEAAVEAKLGVLIARPLAVVAQRPRSLG